MRIKIVNSPVFTGRSTSVSSVKFQVNSLPPRNLSASSNARTHEGKHQFIYRPTRFSRGSPTSACVPKNIIDLELRTRRSQSHAEMWTSIRATLS